MLSASPVLRDIVLIGGGHSHVGVLYMFAMRPLPGVRLTVICSDTDTPYSGMLPGYVAGHYSFDEVHIDLRRLAAFAGARYYHDEVVGIDRAARTVFCRHRPPVRYDALSINIGSTPQLAHVPGAAEHAVPVKPIRRFNERWLALLERVRRHPAPMTIAVVGAGAGGVELLLSMQHRLRRERGAQGRDPDELRFHLFSAEACILPTHNARVQKAFERILALRKVVVHRATTVTHVSAGTLSTGEGEVFTADEFVWVTQAGGAAWLRDTGLALDADGFIRVRETLQSETDPDIFAAGDCASLVARPLEKAGVFAVRMGKPLADNLRRRLTGQSLKPYRPQRRWLALISSGDRNAIASRGGFYAQGSVIWRWKDRIDRRFMGKFSDFPQRRMDTRERPETGVVTQLDAAEQQEALSAFAMRCGGCGAKVGASVLTRALSALRPVERDDILIGLQSPDDAAIVRVPPGRALVHSVDFFRAFIDDPYVFGRIAANHALGDIFAMGGEAQSATAIVTLPPGLDIQVEDTLRQMMTGAVEVLNEAGCALVGGHSGEGAELALGFAINGLIDEALGGVLRKGGMRADEVLILTKPIGTGTLLAAHASVESGFVCKGRWIDAALTSMQVSNRVAAQCLSDHGATACTDLTGFGLIGHLLEMTRASGVDATLVIDQIPVLEGARECVATGVFSTLQPANERLHSALANLDVTRGHPLYPLLFDPQTAGGLLASVPAARATDCIEQLHMLGYVHARAIGSVRAPCPQQAPITIQT